MGFELIGGRCIFASEWNLACQKTYKANFCTTHPIVGDITDIFSEDIPKHDLLLAGFPYQPFSIAGATKKNALGKKHGHSCEYQWAMFYEIARIIAHHRPQAFLLENVKNLLSHDKGHTFRVIRNILEDQLGYRIDWRVINDASFVPQKRERIFIVGFLRDSGFDFSGLKIPDLVDGPKMESVLHPEDGSEHEEPPFTDGKLAKVDSRYTLSPALWPYLKEKAQKHRAKGNGFSYGLVGPHDVARTPSTCYFKNGADILVQQRGKRPRRLTPRECARLMGFDRQGRPPFKIPVSDTQAYIQFANTVAVPVVEAVARHMRLHIVGSMSSVYFSQLRKMS